MNEATTNKQPSTPVAAKLVSEPKLISKYQSLVGRANKLSMQISQDDLSFVISHGANKWTPKRKNTLKELEDFIEGAEQNQMTNSPLISAQQ